MSKNTFTLTMTIGDAFKDVAQTANKAANNLRKAFSN
jgi:predicted secreted acid phosphatase